MEGPSVACGTLREFSGRFQAFSQAFDQAKDGRSALFRCDGTRTGDNYPDALLRREKRGAHYGDDNRLGEKIVTLRTAHHLSSRDLADRCGCDVSVIEGLERGELPASLAPLIKITRALGVRLGTLMDDD